ncbi:MAG: DHH family phosphoesterase [Phycisphaeraceae bacterium]|nr:MAG: DHH family phosphoesterase [Phycisphaeraceae bacterium]
MSSSRVEQYSTTSSLEEIGAFLRGVDAGGTIGIGTHMKPDGDAIGSTLAVTRALRAVGKRVTLLYMGGPPRWIETLATRAERSTFEEDGLPDPEPSVWLILDTGSWSQLEQLTPALTGRGSSVVIIDHHLQGDAVIADRRFIDKNAAAAAQPAAELCRILLGLRSCAELPVEIAEPLFLGLATDTGWFRHSNTKPETLRLAADLIGAGANHSRLYAMVEQSDTVGRLRLVARALGSLELFDNDRIAIMRLSLSDFEQAGASHGDTGGLADMALVIQSVRVSAVITEQSVKAGSPPLTKISMRSKEGPNAVDVNEVCGKLGGGGHARASGARMTLTLEQTRSRVLEALLT